MINQEMDLQRYISCPLFVLSEFRWEIIARFVDIGCMFDSHGSLIPDLSPGL
jgi:hypothetical protein